MKKGFRFPELIFDQPAGVSSGVYLWIWNPDKIPPHIGISKGASYFSLTVRGPEIRKNTQAMLRKAKRLQIPLVLVDLSDWNIENDPEVIFNKYERVKPHDATCLTPITDLLLENTNAMQLADLLESISAAGKLRNVFALHLDQEYREIPPYDFMDIQSRISELNEA